MFTQNKRLIYPKPADGQTTDPDFKSISVDGQEILDDGILSGLTSISLADSSKIKLGDNEDLKIFHNGTDSHIESTSRPLNMLFNTLSLNSSGANGQINMKLATDNDTSSFIIQNDSDVQSFVVDGSGKVNVKSGLLHVGDNNIVINASESNRTITSDSNLEVTIASNASSTFKVRNTNGTDLMTIYGNGVITRQRARMFALANVVIQPSNNITTEINFNIPDSANSLVDVSWSGTRFTNDSSIRRVFMCNFSAHYQETSTVGYRKITMNINGNYRLPDANVTLWYADSYDVAHDRRGQWIPSFPVALDPGEYVSIRLLQISGTTGPQWGVNGVRWDLSPVLRIIEM